jgi:hypothetical protein
VLGWANPGLNLEGMGTCSVNAARGRRPHGKEDLGYRADLDDMDGVAAAVHNTSKSEKMSENILESVREKVTYTSAAHLDAMAA